MSNRSKKTRFNKKGGRLSKTRTKKSFTKNKTQKQFKKLNCSPENKHKEYT